MVFLTPGLPLLVLFSLCTILQVVQGVRYYAPNLIISFVMIHARSYIISQINKYDRQFSSNLIAYIFLHCIHIKKYYSDDCKLMT